MIRFYAFTEGWCDCLGCCHRRKRFSLEWNQLRLSWVLEKSIATRLMSAFQAYSIAGGIYLLTRGQYIFFFFPEWYRYDVFFHVHGVLLNLFAFDA